MTLESSGGVGEERIFLFVPTEEAEEVRRLGAVWDSRIKCWYIDAGADLAAFKRWTRLENESVEDFAISSDQAYVAEATCNCWRCHARIEVRCIFCVTGQVDGIDYQRFSVSNITRIDDALRAQLARWSGFRFGPRCTAAEQTLANFCGECGALQEDYYLHCEPSGIFFSFTNESQTKARFTPLIGRVQMDGDEGFEP
ncbi:MAG TPA: DUF5710 domain-containing protein [Steroidobacteraceae bacterium]|nr:DUF5710 domain-containing protein [Steroidobacteraceae bacterium]